MMVDEISNKTLAVLLIVAIALSLGGTLVSLNRISSIARGPAITGYVSSMFNTGTTNVTIQTTASLRFAVNLLDFGKGAVNTTAGNTLCSIASSTAGGTKAANTQCINFTAVGSIYSLQLENDGDMNLTVNMSADKNATNFIGGGASGAEQFLWTVGNNETNSCNNITGPGTGNWSNMNTTSMLVCSTGYGAAMGGLGFITTQNSLAININLTIPSDSTKTTSNNLATITATGTTLS